MTNEEAIKFLKQIYPNGGHCWLDEQRTEAIDMAIAALNKKEVSVDYDKLKEQLHNTLAKETKESLNEFLDEEECNITGIGVREKVTGKLREILDKKDYRERYKRIAESEQFKKTHEGMSIGEVMHIEGEEPVSDDFEKTLGTMLNDGLPDMYLVSEERVKKSADLLLSIAYKKFKQEEPVSIWHDMSEEVENGRNIIIIDPKNFYGAVLRKGGSQLRNHNKERYVKWAYIDDIINVTNKEEPVSEDLGEYINELSKQFPEVSFAKLSRIAVRVAKWQEKQDQSTIELAEDHAYFAGRTKTIDEMMEKAKSGTVQKDNQVILDDGTYMDLDPSMQLKPSFVGLKEGDRIKVILIKED